MRHLKLSLGAAVALLTAGFPLQAEDVRISARGYTTYGEWVGDMQASPDAWSPGDNVRVTSTLLVGNNLITNLATDNIKVDGFALLVTAERTFDAQGWIRLPSDERMSTLLTPTGLPIEGGTQGAVTNRYSYGFRTPFDQLVRVPLSAAVKGEGTWQATFNVEQKLPADLPPGVYRLRLDYGVTVGTRYYSLQARTFAARHSAIMNRAVQSHLYSPPIPASGNNAVGQYLFGPEIPRRLPWILLNNYNSNGYRGVIAEEDKYRFNLASRNLIQDDIILPLYDSAGRVVSYSLEPQFPTDTIELWSNIPWNFSSGAINVQVTAPDGKTTDLGNIPFAGASGQWPTTKNAAVTAWKPASYGQYEVRLTGWIADAWGNIYSGGGTYRFWIANRMTMATATFQGMAYPVGTKYGRDIGFAPAFPADVEVEAALYVNSDPNNARRMKWSGKASPGGTYGTAQGGKQLPLDAPGEYSAHILAKYTDQKGNLWVCSMRHAGVVYPEDSRIVARGKKLYLGGKYVDRGETHFEGYYDTAQQIGSLAHINYPWNSGDVLLIASEGQTANKIEPVLTYEWKDKPEAYNSRLNTIGITNLQLKTSNGYSPHLYPEYITEWAYYYAAGPRPGFMSRFLVSEDGSFAPYWQTSPNSFGGQINASNNGDLPGDIYRLVGGVAVRRPGEDPAYAGYLSSAFLLPEHSDNNRIVVAGSEDVIGPTGQKARFFLVGTRPGMMYETGSAFSAALQIDPIIPANVKVTLDTPDGRTLTTTGKGDAFGSFVGTRWTLDQPGIYRYHLEAEWDGHVGIMPGLPADGGTLYVVERDKPASAREIQFNLPAESYFTPPEGVHITGTSTAESISYAAVIPGAVIDQGQLTVTNGKFDYYFDPKTINQRVATYDVENRVSGRPEVFDVVHLTFFSREKDANHSFARIIIRGNKVICAK